MGRLALVRAGGAGLGWIEELDPRILPREIDDRLVALFGQDQGAHRLANHGAARADHMDAAGRRDGEFVGHRFPLKRI